MFFNVFIRIFAPEKQDVMWYSSVQKYKNFVIFFNVITEGCGGVLVWPETNKTLKFDSYSYFGPVPATINGVPYMIRIDTFIDYIDNKKWEIAIISDEGVLKDLNSLGYPANENTLHSLESNDTFYINALIK